ncbi:hypothetical protein EST38_g7846 [Candolleomyces aberdarensis]|uniref:Uncharacterized protein n=1 Tax=Candolleomyces aberdarensis TaxID=2316362 RepID=A0A4Q2DEN9_9AGAR|nr:hypothetical protein EST38_g7846 [Candolleomyces aberdarensis]
MRSETDGEFFALWPTPEVEALDTYHEPKRKRANQLPRKPEYTSDRLDEWIAKRKSQIGNWFNNRATEARRAAPPMPPPAVEYASKAPKVLSDVQLYAKQFVKQEVRDSWNKLLESVEKKDRLARYNDLARDALNGESSEVRKAVQEARDKAKRERDEALETERAMMQSKPAHLYRTKEMAAAVAGLPEAIASFCNQVGPRSGWCFTILAGGPDPNHPDGNIQTFTYHHGRTQAGASFGAMHPGVVRAALADLHAFCHLVTPYEERVMRIANPSAEMAEKQRLYRSEERGGTVAQSEEGDEGAGEAGPAPSGVADGPSSTRSPSPTSESVAVPQAQAEKPEEEVAVQRSVHPESEPVREEQEPAEKVPVQGGLASSIQFTVNSIPPDLFQSIPEPQQTDPESSVSDWPPIIDEDEDDADRPTLPPASPMEEEAAETNGGSGGGGGPLEQGAEGSHKRRREEVENEDDVPGREERRSTRRKKTATKERPEWMDAAQEYLRRGPDVQAWRVLVDVWLAFEQGMTASTLTMQRLPAGSKRPETLSRWITAGKKYPTVPTLNEQEREEFATAWLDWWKEMQPVARKYSHDDELPLPLQAKHDLSTIKKGGPSGLVLALIGLKWWYRPGLRMWDRAVEDLRGCLEKMTR